MELSSASTHTHLQISTYTYVACHRIFYATNSYAVYHSKAVMTFYLVSKKTFASK